MPRRTAAVARIREAVVPEWLADAVPEWLAEAVRPKRAPVPWAQMVRAAIAITVPLAAAMALHETRLGLLPAMGGLLATLVDVGGPYRARLRRVGSASVFGGAAGLTIGLLIHGRGWITVVCLVVVAGVSALLSAISDTGSATGLQLLVYSALGLGPLGAMRPWWEAPLSFAAGAVWAFLLVLPGWLLSPHAAAEHRLCVSCAGAGASVGRYGRFC
jgi:uncharacterized membrane protein YccC